MTLFQAEKRDRGFEYLLILPVSRLKIFLYKYLPRLVALVILVAALAFFAGMSFKAILIPLLVVQAA